MQQNTWNLETANARQLELAATALLHGGDIAKASCLTYGKNKERWQEIDEARRTGYYLDYAALQPLDSNNVDEAESQAFIARFIDRLQWDLNEAEIQIVKDMIEPRQEVIEAYPSYDALFRIKRFFGLSHGKLVDLQAKLQKVYFEMVGA